MARVPGGRDPPGHHSGTRQSPVTCSLPASKPVGPTEGCPTRVSTIPSWVLKWTWFRCHRAPVGPEDPVGPRRSLAVAICHLACPLGGVTPASTVLTWEAHTGTESAAWAPGHGMRGREPHGASVSGHQGSEGSRAHGSRAGQAGKGGREWPPPWLGFQTGSGRAPKLRVFSRVLPPSGMRLEPRPGQPCPLPLAAHHPLRPGIPSFCLSLTSTWTAEHLRTGPLSWLPTVPLGLNVDKTNKHRETPARSKFGWRIQPASDQGAGWSAGHGGSCSGGRHGGRQHCPHSADGETEAQRRWHLLEAAGGGGVLQAQGADGETVLRRPVHVSISSTNCATAWYLHLITEAAAPPREAGALQVGRGSTPAAPLGPGGPAPDASGKGVPRPWDPGRGLRCRCAGPPPPAPPAARSSLRLAHYSR